MLKTGNLNAQKKSEITERLELEVSVEKSLKRVNLIYVRASNNYVVDIDQ